MRISSFFTGAGGLDLGFKKLAFSNKNGEIEGLF